LIAFQTTPEILILKDLESGGFYIEIKSNLLLKKRGAVKNFKQQIFI
tara:strand:- start:43 stop:183 length:141 start_codon:yes stop_codon:yes gene_type:complete